MGRLEKFLGKEEVVQINGEDFRVPPLTIGDLPLILGAYKGDQVDPVGMFNLVMKYLKINFPEETEEELKKFPFLHMSGLMDAIMKANGMGGDERLQKIKANIAAKAAEKAEKV